MLTVYARFIIHHSYLYLFGISIILTIITIIPLVCHDLPSFSDPVVGFETRGTTLSNRFIAWENLIDETRPSKSLAVNPTEIEDQRRMNQTYHNKVTLDKTRSGHGKKKNRKNKNKTRLKTHESKNSSIVNETLNNHVHWGYGKNVSYEDINAEILKNHTRKQWVSLKAMRRKPDSIIHNNYASGICGSPVSEYAHLVVSSKTNTSMLDYENIVMQCKLQSLLVQIATAEYDKMCQRSTRDEELCCPMWSVPNYFALMSGKTSCENLTRDDVSNAVVILEKCASYFHDFKLMASCELDRCKVPKYCSQYDAVYNLLFYLLDVDAFSPPKFSETFVKNAMIFLPLACSRTVLPYYQKLETSNMAYDTLLIPAMDFGLKNALFDLWIIQDTWLIGLGGLFVFICAWVYTKSLLLTTLLFIAIAYSLGVAYFLYVYVLNLQFFPFMNLLVIVVVIGIGADDAFLYVKIWKMISNQLIRDNIVSTNNGITDIKNVSSAGETILIQALVETLKHSILTMFITTLTTAVAFFASYVSYIPAINCFSVFAGTAVFANFLIMITLLPVSVYIVDVKMHSTYSKISSYVIYKAFNKFGDNIQIRLNKLIVTIVTKTYICIVMIFGIVGIGSIVVVFYTPGLQLPDSRQFQLFQSSHPFEKYDMLYRDRFLFERFGKDLGTGSKMPIRWVWGVKAIDNGNHMDPESTGHLVFDPDFSISEPKSQLWLSEFCKRIKGQPFYQQTLGPLLPNCFIETFRMFMSRRCIDNIDKINRKPCCESSHFPYKKEVFEYCIVAAMKSLYQTPRELFIPGVAGPKFLRSANPPNVSAIVIEFESVVPYSMSYTAMNQFFSQVENWTQYELKTAPAEMSHGWFHSDLQFYDLQKTLASGTVMALLLSAGLGFLVLIPATFSFIVSICALVAMVFSSTVTIAILVLSGWKLNILESVAISTSAGLAVDFSLHYALSYTNASGTKTNRVKYALTASSGPTAAAALTTGFAGIFLLRSNLLPYSQIGVFLALIMSVSWVYATFFLCSLLNIFGRNSNKDPPVEERKTVSRVSSICSGVPNLESHELEHLADSNPTNITYSHSPSTVSATTVVLHDDCEKSLKTYEKNLSIDVEND